MAKPTGYKATRKSVIQRKQEARERIWRNADVPPFWESELGDPVLLREMLLRAALDQAFALPPSASS